MGIPIPAKEERMRITNIIRRAPLLAALAAIGMMPARAVGVAWQIVPGQRIGHVHIGDTRTAVHHALAAPDVVRPLGGGLVQERWLSKPVNPSSRAQPPDYVTVYFQNGVTRQVEVSSWHFEAAGALSTLSRFHDLEAAYPPTRHLITSFSPSRAGVALRMFYDDDTHHGIAWKGAIESGMIPDITGDLQLESLIVHGVNKYVIPDPGGHGNIVGSGPITAP
jgi:hypothetical protein